MARRRSGSPRPSRRPRARSAAGEVFLGTTCVMCHTIQGTPAAGRVGPDLTHVASRPRIAAGTLPNTRGHLAGWVVDPQSIKPGVRMPLNPLTPDDLRRPARLPGEPEVSRRPTWRREPTATTSRAAGSRPDAAGTTPRPLALERTWVARPGLRRLAHHDRTTRTSACGSSSRRSSSSCSAGVLALLMRLQLAVPQNTLPRPRPLQPALHHARHDDDVPLRRAGDGGDGPVPRAADGRHAERLRSRG